MATIKQVDLIGSIADALQFISYYHPPDFLRAMKSAYEREESAAAKAAPAARNACFMLPTLHQTLANHEEHQSQRKFAVIRALRGGLSIFRACWTS